MFNIINNIDTCLGVFLNISQNMIIHVKLFIYMIILDVAQREYWEINIIQIISI